MEDPLCLDGTNEQPIATLSSCINLQANYGDQYRIDLDEAYWADHEIRIAHPDSWFMQIACKHGHIYPHGGQLLAASTDRRGGIARKLLDLPCCQVHQDGDDGVTVLFAQTDFDRVAAIMQPRKRRQVSPEQRARLSAMGRATLEKLRQANSQNDSTGPELAATGLGGQRGKHARLTRFDPPGAT